MVSRESSSWRITTPAIDARGRRRVTTGAFNTIQPSSVDRSSCATRVIASRACGT